MASQLESFISEVKNRGLAKTNLFNVDIHTPPCLQDTGALGVQRIVNLFCQSASFPGTNIGVRELRITGPSYKRPYNIDYGGEGIALTFLVDNSMDMKGYFDLWLHKIINPFEFTAVYDEKNTKYTTEIFINQISKIYQRSANEPAISDDSNYYIKLEDAFPRNISMIELDNSATNSSHKITVNFAYRKINFFNKITNTGVWEFRDSPQ